MDAETCQRLDKAFADVRMAVKDIHEKALSEGNFSAPFHGKDVEDILFYQIANGLPIA